MAIRQSVFSIHVRYMLSPVRLSVCLSVTFLHPTQAISRGQTLVHFWSDLCLPPPPTIHLHHWISTVKVNNDAPKNYK